MATTVDTKKLGEGFCYALKHGTRLAWHAFHYRARSFKLSSLSEYCRRQRYIYCDVVPAVQVSLMLMLCATVLLKVAN